MFVGGFLGAGKTTLILRAAALLQRQGARVAVITNDQDHGLVDTRLAAAKGVEAGEVAGGCFCCRFSDLIEAAERLTAYAPDVIFAEPVGSCIDISATILQPLKTYYRQQYQLAPFTLLVDPEFARRVFAGDATSDVSFLFGNQLAEADILCTTKSDQYARSPEILISVDFRLSSATGLGVDEWLNEVLNGKRVAGSRILDVDYGRYAKAEAALGWVNIHGDLVLSAPAGPLATAGPVLDEIEAQLTREGIEIAHLKMMDQTRSGFVRAGICRNGEEPVPEGDLLAGPERQHEIAINLRAVGDPERLRAIVHGALAKIPGKLTVRHDGAFRPAAPKPEHRFGAVV